MEDHTIYDQTPKSEADRIAEAKRCEESTMAHRQQRGIPVDAVFEAGKEVLEPVHAAELISERSATEKARRMYLNKSDALRRPLFDQAEELAGMNPYRGIDAQEELVGYRDLLNAGTVAIHSALFAMERYWRFGGDPQIVSFMKGLNVRGKIHEALNPICEVRNALDAELLCHDTIELEDRERFANTTESVLERLM
jgi:hypothetical protein